LEPLQFFGRKISELKNNRSMKKLTLLTLFVAFFYTVNVSAQENYSNEVRTLAGDGLNFYSSGGYGGFKMAYGAVDGLDAFFIGGQGGWVVNHRLVIGGGGMGFTSQGRFDANLNRNYRFEGGYGGLLLEYFLQPTKLVHLSFPLLIGGGGVGYEPENISSGIAYQEAGFFLVNPGIELQLNVLSFMRIAIGGSYLFTSDVDLRYANNDQRIATGNLLNGPTATIAFKFGRF